MKFFVKDFFSKFVLKNVLKKWLMESFIFFCAVKIIAVVELNYSKLIYYKVRQSLLQSGTGITKWSNYYRKVGQLCVITILGKAMIK